MWRRRILAALPQRCGGFIETALPFGTMRSSRRTEVATVRPAHNQAVCQRSSSAVSRRTTKLYQIAALGFKRGSELDVHRHSRSHVGKYHDFRKQDVVRKNFSSDLASTPSSSNLNDIFLSVQTKSATWKMREYIGSVFVSRTSGNRSRKTSAINLDN